MNQRKYRGIPYGWGAFVRNELLYFSDGKSIYFTNFFPKLEK